MSVEVLNIGCAGPARLSNFSTYACSMSQASPAFSALCLFCTTLRNLFSQGRAQEAFLNSPVALKVLVLWELCSGRKLLLWGQAQNRESQTPWVSMFSFQFWDLFAGLLGGIIQGSDATAQFASWYKRVGQSNLPFGTKASDKGVSLRFIDNTMGRQVSKAMEILIGEYPLKRGLIELY